MKKFIIFQFVLAAVLLGGCTEKFDTPARYEPVTLVTNTTIAELKAMYTGSETIVMADAIIGGKVISTDEYGSNYRSLFIEDETSGIEVKVGKSAMYNTYKVGQTIYVKAQHLALGAYGTFISLGAPDPNPNDSYQNTWIDVQLWIDMTVFRGALGTPVVPKVINNFSGIVPSMHGTLVTLKGMKYTPSVVTPAPPDTWAKKNEQTPGGNAQNQPFTFPDGTHTMVIRTSNYADFAGDPVPAANSISDLTGILTVFNSTIQLILNSVDDVVPTGTRN